LNTLAWDNKIWRSAIFVGFKAEAMINRDSRGCSYSSVRGEILGPLEDVLKRKHSPRMSPLIKNES